MSGEVSFTAQVVSCWVTLGLLVLLGLVILARFRPVVRQADAPGLWLLGLSAFLLRWFLSPHTLVHENAHGYEYLRSVFGLEGFFYHGSGYYAFHHLLCRLGGMQPESVFLGNALLGTASTLLLVPIGRRLTRSREAAWIAAAGYACWPVVLRIGASESMFPLAVFFALLAWIAWMRAWDTGRLAWFALAGCALAFALQVRPGMVLWPIVLGLSLAACPGWTRRLRSPWPWVTLGLFLILLAPWMAFRAQMLRQEGIPDLLRLSPGGFAAGLFSPGNLFARPDWTPVLAWPLAAAGLVVLAWRQRWRSLALTLGWVPLAWLVVGVATGDSSSVRLQNPLVPFFLLWVGVGASWLADRAGSRWRFPVIALVGSLLVATALARLPMVRHQHNPQAEYAFLSRALPELPGKCAIVTADRFMANRVLSTEFPRWWAGDRPVIQQHEFLADPVLLADWSCIVYYRGLSCYCFTHEEGDRMPPDGVRSECRRLESLPAWSPRIEETFPNRPYTSFRVPAEWITLGFYRIR